MRRAYPTIKRTEAGKRKSRNWLPLIFLVLLASFFYSSYKLIDGFITSKNERDAFKELSELVAKNTLLPERGIDKISPPEREGDTADSASISDADFSDSPKEKTPLLQYLPLCEVNPDFFGWLAIAGTDMDFPVMYSPDRPDYYLDHAFDGSSSSSGVPFVDGHCPPDGNYYLIYGHHMRNKTMFGQLPQYADLDYYNEHPIIRFDTLYEQREYRVFAVFYSRVYGMSESGVFRYYEYYDLSEKEVFDEYIKEVRAAAIYETGVVVTFGDELLVLSTCNYHTENGRFVVVAKRI